MSDLVGQLIWIFGTIAILGLISVAYYTVNKIGSLIAKRPIEINFTYFLAGAFAGMLFLPSRDHASAQSRLELATALIGGAFVGGVFGLLIRWSLSNRPSSLDPRSPNGQQIRKAQQWFERMDAKYGEYLLRTLFLLCAPIFLYVQFHDQPILSPIVQFFRHWFCSAFDC